MTSPASPPAPRSFDRVAPWVAWVFRVALGVVFIAASVHKLVHPADFARSIANYRILPDELVNLAAIGLPWIEALSGAALVLGLSVRANLLVVEGLLALFIGALGWALARRLDVGCGCFSAGTEAQAMSRGTLLWDVVWFAMGLFALRYDRGYLSLALVRRRRLREPSA
ncbi:MAG: DoxX family membrane protein [Deltaproteobacteria bacterium]|nr:DoxX family membrane protein [Deltaproteobacteria bacterium]